MRKKSKKLNVFILALAVIFGSALIYFFALPKTPTVKVYFIKDGRLAFVNRPINEKQDALSLSVFELLKGPNNSEKKQGFFTEMPANVRILEIKQKGPVLEIKFNSEIKKVGGGSSRVFGLVAQIVYTFTEIKGFEKVLILIDDEDEVVLGGEGFVIDKPLSREDVKY